ncbi:MAG: hypothetical protein ACE5EV_03590 [Gaiellales bacterium]
MRLSILLDGHDPAAKAALADVQAQFSTEIVPGSRATLLYRPAFFGRSFGNYLHAVMRGPSAWSVGERELMAALVSRLNHCPW